MPKLDLKSGGIVGFALLVVVIVLAIRACRPVGCSTESATGDSEGAAA